MNSFTETFEGTELSNSWHSHPDATVSDHTLSFFPQECNSAQIVAKDTCFSDFEIIVDVRIVQYSVGLILRWQDPEKYYMVQFDINDWHEERAKSVWFHAWHPDAECGMYRKLYPSAKVPETGTWYRMKVTVKGYDFATYLGEIGGVLELCAEWSDPNRYFDSGAIGMWQHPGGEKGQYRNVLVTALQHT